MMPRRAVGRPRSTSHEQIEAVARKLFRERGYSATSLESIAQAVGISRTSLFAYFPSKGDLIWGMLEHVTKGLEQALDHRPADEPLGKAILVALRQAFDFPSEEHAAVAERLEIIDADPELRSYNAEGLRYQAELIANFIGVRLGEPATGFLPRVVSEAVMAAVVSAARYWATTGSATGPMIDYIEAAVRPLLKGYGPELRRSQVFPG